MFPQVEVFPWDRNFETGIPLIDEQHKQLVSLLNKLVNHLAFQSDAPTLNSVFDQLRDYTVIHFRAEEGIWAQHLQGDQWETQHMHSHTHFIDEVIRLKSEEHHKPLDEVIGDIVRFLTHWLALHILESDKRLAIVVAGKQSGLSLSDAKAAADHAMSGATRVLVETVMSMYDKLANRTVQMTREITRRRRAEDELHVTHEALKRAKDDAESASRAKSEFLANMSHEIRTPMNAIHGMIHLMKQDGLPDSQAARLKNIESACDHLLSVINNILDLSKIEAGKLALDLQPLTLDAVIEEVRSLVAGLAEAKGLALEIDPAPHVGTVIGDPTRIKQALINLAMNAVKFTETGSITIRSRIESEVDDELVVRLEVEDTGSGISPDVAGRLFHAFEQGDNSATRRHGGTGLGLAITRRLAKLMGGSAGLESTPARGSVFWFTMHLRRQTAAAPALPSLTTDEIEQALRAKHGNARILLVEDDAINRAVAVGMLKHAGLVVDTAENGLLALERVARNDYALILMDMQMPRMDGLEATKRLRATRRGERTPIVAMTANAFVEDKQRCMQAGMNDFITKPVTPAILFATVLHWLDRH